MSDYNDHSKQVSTRGEPRVGHEHENEPAAGPIGPRGQHEGYWVLSEEERAKGFVRPLRASYRHVGRRPEFPTRPLTDEEKARYSRFDYVAFEPYPEERLPSTGRFWTRDQLASGCGSVTSMSKAIAETYARSPSFYGSTFCCKCGSHYAVDEFVWEGTDERVGS